MQFQTNTRQLCRTDLRVNLLQRAEKRHKGRTAKVGDGPQAGEETAVPHLLKVALTHILSAHEHTTGGNHQCFSFINFFIHSFQS